MDCFFFFLTPVSTTLTGSVFNLCILKMTVSVTYCFFFLAFLNSATSLEIKRDDVYSIFALNK